MSPFKYRKDIDGMRAIAVLLVLVFHFSLLTIGDAGFMGVDVFFVISGFLITGILKGQLDAAQFKPGAFYANRIKRLAPALFAVLVLVTIAGALLLFPIQFCDLAKQVLASQFYVSNIYYWRTVNYFGFGVNDVYLLHTWSLAVEEQFYLLYPLFLWALHRYLRDYFWPALLVALLASFALNIAIVNIKPEAAFYLLPTRGWELLIGALIPIIGQKWTRSRLTDDAIGVAAIALLLIAIIRFRSDIRYPGYFALLPTLAAGGLLLSGASGLSPVSQALSWRPLTYIGKISYSLYLVHWPINIFAQVLIGHYTLGWRLAMFALSVLLAAILYHSVEDRFRLMRGAAVNRKVLTAYAIGLTATVVVVAVVLQSGGIPQRFPAEVIRLASFVNDRSPPLTECEFADAAASAKAGICRVGAKDKAPTWMVYGDSHAWAAHAAFDKWLTVNDQSGYFMFLHGCPPLVGVHLVGDRDRCFEFNQFAQRFIENSPLVRHVALVSVWRQAIEGLLSGSTKVLGTREESIQLFTAQFAQTVQQLNKLNRQVYVWEPVPGARGSAPLALARAALTHVPADIETDRSVYLTDNEYFFKALKANCASIAGSFSPAQALCASGRCAVEYAGNPLYSDNAHITNSTAHFWVQVLQNPIRCK